MKDYIDVEIELDEEIIKIIQEQADLEGISFNDKINIILKGYIIKKEECPKCGLDTVQYSNIHGFYCWNCKYRWE